MSEEKSPFLSDYRDHEGGELEDVMESSPQTRVLVMSRKKWIPLIICLVVILLAVLVVVGVCIGLFAVPGNNSGRSHPGNGTENGNVTREICANPPVLLISMDGFRADYLERNLTPNLQSLIDSGVRAEYMRSSFPTLTFPNHYSIVTGLYPESHGMINNAFYDSKLREKFFTRSVNATDGKWWGGEPVWVTAVKNKLIAGVYYWPGSEAEIKGIRPSYYFPYQDSTPFDVRVNTVLGWLDLSKDKRPQFIAMYLNEPDHTGHMFGPDSSELNTTLGVVDRAIRRLWEGLQDRNISECVNIMFVSDHGMSPTNYSKIVYANELLSADLFSSGNLSFPSIGPVMNIDVIGGDDTVQEVYQSFVTNGTYMGDPFRVFHTDNLPLRMHTGHFNKQRYGPVYLIADDHSYLRPIASHRPPAGNHGYDNIERTMRAIFIAHGPAFKQNYVAQSIENIQLYSLMCELLNITAASNNGTVGSLRQILDPQVAKKFSPPTASGGSPGVEDNCPFPQDNDTFVLRSICDVCVCNDSCNVSESTILTSNRNSFNHTDAQETQYQQQHFPWGIPLGGRGSGACLLSQPDFVHIYSNSLHIPLLVGYTLTGEVLQNVSDVCVRRDPRVAPANSANCSLYNATTEDVSLWNSDELAREGDEEEWESTEDSLLWYVEEDALSPVAWVLPTNETFVRHGLSTGILSATAPLRPSFIVDVWIPVRQALTNWLLTYHELHVMVGSVLDADRNGLRDSDSTYPRVEGVAVPSHVFVVVTRCGDSGTRGGLGSCDAEDLEVLGMLFQHPLETGDYSDSHRVLRYALTPLRDIERVTGLNFFPNLPAEQQNLLELRLLDELWPSTSIA